MVAYDKAVTNHLKTQKPCADLRIGCRAFSRACEMPAYPWQGIGLFVYCTVANGKPSQALRQGGFLFCGGAGRLNQRRLLLD